MISEEALARAAFSKVPICERSVLVDAVFELYKEAGYRAPVRALRYWWIVLDILYPTKDSMLLEVVPIEELAPDSAAQLKAATHHSFDIKKEYS